MIKILQNKELEVSKTIQEVFQLSYKVEAQLLNAVDFPPLKRQLESYLESHTSFYGYFENNELAGVIEIEPNQDYIRIKSLVILPKYFKLGIATKLLQFVFELFKKDRIIVETGFKNTPATNLYLKHGFKEIKQYDAEFGIRKVRFERLS